MSSSNSRAVVAALAVSAAFAAAAGTTQAEDVPSGYGASSPNGSVFTTQITNPPGEIKNPAPGQDDHDAYSFQGFPGMALTVTVKPSKGSALVPLIEVVRPGGSLVTDDEGLHLGAKGTSATASMKLDTAGWWQVRVSSRETSRRLGDATAGEKPEDRYVAFSSGEYSVTIKYGKPVLTALPQITKTFKVSGAIDTKSDVDEFPFEGYIGQTVGGSLKFADTLIPQVEIVRPDGTVAVGPADQTVNGSKITFPTFSMDQQGTWRARVIGLEPDPDPDVNVINGTTGTYTLQVKLSKYKTPPSLLPDGNGQYRFTLPGAPGATIGFDLKYDGAAPTFNSLVDSSGRPVPGISGAVVARTGGLTMAGVTLLGTQPIGNYTVTFDAPATPPIGVSFTPKLALPKGAKKRKATMAPEEPIILNGSNGVNPTAGGGGTLLVVGTNGKLVDPNDDAVEKLKVYLGHVPLLSVEPNGNQLRGYVPPELPLGTYDVVVESTTGQVGVKVGSFQVVEPPKATAIDPNIGTSAGGFLITIEGEGFRPGHMGIRLDGATVPVNVQETTTTSITFTAPPHYGAPKVTFGVFDNETQLSGNLPNDSFEYVATASITRLVPSLTTVLGGETIIVRGTSFAATDHVYLETATPGTYQDMSLVAETFVDSTRHQFVSPVRPKGVYRVYVTDQFDQPQPPRTRNLTYFQFTDLTAAGGVLPSGADQWDGSTNTVGDFDKDGSDDLFITRRGGGTLAGTSNTRVLRNDGTGHFTDVTGGVNAVMPAVTSSDDWRADRIWLSDVNLDGYGDLLLVTNDSTALPSNRSHLRILVNEPRSGLSTEDRVFRDRTVDLMAPIRLSSQLYGGGGETVVDNWRGLDMWVGDIDKGSAASPPEILITHKEVKEELDVGCGNYCASPYSSGYTYGFYWGGSRAFVWNKTAKGGAGQYKFDYNFFPRKAGVRVQIFNPPAGITIPICNSQYNQPCRGKFAPYIGKRIAVGDINADGKPDVAVLSDGPVTKNGATISSLQVGINKFNPNDGALITDVDSALTALGGNFQGDTVEIGQPGFPDGNAFGVIATSKAVAGGGGSVMRLTKYKVSQIVGEVAAFDDISAAALPGVYASEQWQASRILFRDVDGDGDQDMLIVCNPAPGTDPAFRVLRNEIVDQKVGVFRESLKGLITPLVTATEHFEGDWMSIGDVNKDGTLDFVISRATTTQPAPQTRILITDR